MEKLLQVEQSIRDEKWENDFFLNLPEQKFLLVDDQPKEGPDGWPYMFANIYFDQNINKSTNQNANQNVKENTIKNTETESFLNLSNWLVNKGIGLVINPEKAYPDYVFTYGMLWFYKYNGIFLQKVKSDSNDVSDLLDLSAQHWGGDPSESFLPEGVRKIIKHFFMDQGVLDVKVGMLSSDKINYDLCFSIESLGSPPKTEWHGILEAVSWFLPAHYSLRLLSEKQFNIFKSL